MTKCNDSLILMCRSLGGFKSNIRNKATPKGCIVEGYIATKLVTFYSIYLHDALTFHNRPQRNQDGFKGPRTQFYMD